MSRDCFLKGADPNEIMSVSLRIVRAADEVVQAHVEEVRESDEDGKGWFNFSSFILTERPICPSDDLCKGDLGNPSLGSELFEPVGESQRNRLQPY